MTFDDGPSRMTTPKVLKALEKNESRATFFVLGNRINKSTAELLRSERALGCEIGNHSYDHAFLVGKSRRKIYREFHRTDRQVYRITGQTPALCRAPYGAFNKKVAPSLAIFKISTLFMNGNWWQATKSALLIK